MARWHKGVGSIYTREINILIFPLPRGKAWLRVPPFNTQRRTVKSPNARKLRRKPSVLILLPSQDQSFSNSTSQSPVTL